MAVTEASIAAVLREWARQQPDAPAYTYVDYDVDPAGYRQTLTWSELYGRVQVLAAEIATVGAPGDRAAILAPQGLEYVVAFYGALEAGLVAVPLPVPQFGAHDERASAALQDCAPTVLLTTSAVVDDVVGCARSLPGKATGADRGRQPRPRRCAGLPGPARAAKQERGAAVHLRLDAVTGSRRGHPQEHPGQRPAGA